MMIDPIVAALVYAGIGLFCAAYYLDVIAYAERTRPLHVAVAFTLGAAWPIMVVAVVIRWLIEVRRRHTLTVEAIRLASEELDRDVKGRES
jgi:uncharacterized membrane protein